MYIEGSHEGVVSRVFAIMAIYIERDIRTNYIYTI